MGRVVRRVAELLVCLFVFVTPLLCTVGEGVLLPKRSFFPQKGVVRVDAAVRRGIAVSKQVFPSGAASESRNCSLSEANKFKVNWARRVQRRKRKGCPFVLEVLGAASILRP